MMTRKYSLVISTAGKAHLFALAKEMANHEVLTAIYTGYPWLKLKTQGVPRNLVRTFPYVRPLAFVAKRMPSPIREEAFDFLHHLSLETIDLYARKTMPRCDIFVGHEGAGLNSGRYVRENGGLYICDRGCSHIAWQSDLLAEEHARFGLPPRSKPRSFDRELAEYEACDHIVVPSMLARRSFLEKGFSPSKISVVGYGTNPPGSETPDNRPKDRFNVLFAGQFGLRKGAGDVLTAFRNLDIEGKQLTIAGEITPEASILFSKELSAPDIMVLGPVSSSQLRTVMRSSHVLLLPSIEDGFGMVVCEAAACGCPAIVSANTGAADWVEHGVNGYVVPIRSPDAICSRLSEIASDLGLWRALSDACLDKVQGQAGWASYGASMLAVFERLMSG